MSDAPPPRLAVIIPALNEEESIGRVIADIPRELNARVVVGNNGSTDHTAEIACAAGAVVVDAPRRGYGSACLAALAEVARWAELPDILVFLDGDYSDYPDEMPALIRPIADDGYDLVIGSRVLGEREPGALLPQARFGNWLSTRLIRVLFGVRYTDLGPFRAIRYDAFRSLDMRDPDFGWTVEMQVKAAQAGLRITEVPVRYRKRIGTSKISGTVSGSIMAGIIIVKTIVIAWLGRTKMSPPSARPSQDML